MSTYFINTANPVEDQTSLYYFSNNKIYSTNDPTINNNTFYNNTYIVVDHNNIQIPDFLLSSDRFLKPRFIDSSTLPNLLNNTLPSDFNANLANSSDIFIIFPLKGINH